MPVDVALKVLRHVPAKGPILGQLWAISDFTAEPSLPLCMYRVKIGKNCTIHPQIVTMHVYCLMFTLALALKYTQTMFFWYYNVNIIYYYLYTNIFDNKYPEFFDQFGRNMWNLPLKNLMASTCINMNNSKEV